MNDIKSETSRVVHNTDAIAWLKEQGVMPGCSFIASIPDISEFSQFSLDQWKNWLKEAVRVVLNSCPDDGLALFFQTDIKYEGTWVDKSFLCQEAAGESGHQLLAHKIICRTPVNSTTFSRPAFSHLLCFSKNIRFPVSPSLPDVINGGKKVWIRGMGVEACKLACDLILRFTETKTVVHPFCGLGTMLAVANDMGLNAIGIELSRKRAERAQKLSVHDIK
ncbi:site-specific DNA-methyltransferase [bacterium]|nr:site-specific DNA-methyltransferase [bacterium]